MLIQNALMTPDGTIILSEHTHDYVTYTDSSNGEEYMVDGGLEYLRRSVADVKEDLSLTSEDTHSKIREKYLWGTYGKEGNKPFHRVRLKDMETDHIKAVLDVCHISPIRRKIFNTELLYRTPSSEEKITC